jgi:16S rRNA (uracil1498-N3)-methyltransferase
LSLHLPPIHVAIDRESRRFTRCSDDDKSAVGTRLILHPGTDTLFPNAAGRDQVETPITVAVGPEGGFTEDEVRLAFEAGFEAVKLKMPILRIETAAVVSAALSVTLIGGA